MPDVDAAMPAMLERGSQFFADIELHQVDAAGRELLHVLAQHGEGASANSTTLKSRFSSADQVAQTLALLIRCELIEQSEHGYCFQVEAMRRWFAKSG